jgi:hypothetical protein
MNSFRVVEFEDVKIILIEGCLEKYFLRKSI